MEIEKNIDTLRNNIAIEQKKGLPFIITSVLIWFLISIISMLDINLYLKNTLVLCCSCIFMPVAWIVGKILKVNIFSKENELLKLGFLFTLNQLIYLLIVMWVLNDVPEKMIMVYAMVFGAHFFPYSWLYKSISFKIVAIVIPIISLVLGCTIKSSTAVSIAVCLVEVFLSFSLWLELKKMQ